MSTLENLTAKILADSEAEAARITDEAKAEAGRVVAELLAEAEREKEKLLADAGREAAREEEQLVVGRTLAVRDQNLAAKQQTLDKVFAEALARLKAMSKDDYLKFLTASLIGLDPDGEELLLPARYGVGIDEVNAALKAAGKKGNLRPSAAAREIDSGFVLLGGGVERNYTVESLMGYYRYELESEVIRALY